MKNAAEEAQRILREAKETADQTIRQINKLGKAAGYNKELEGRAGKAERTIKENRR